jgi:nitrite reductase/ring-hydroxylating ferredoxin subunit
MEDKAYSAEILVNPVASTETQTHEFVRAGTLEELKCKGRLLVHGPHRPILVVEEQDRVYALDNRCPHMGFPLDRGSVEDGILTCHWHHARFDLASPVPIGVSDCTRAWLTILGSSLQKHCRAN